MASETTNRLDTFRFFHTARQVMYPVELFTSDEVHRAISEQDAPTDEAFYAIADHPFRRDEGVLMESTGLTDRKGNPIWEGDILLTEYPCQWGRREDLPMNFFTVVVFRFGMFGHISRPDGMLGPLIDPHSSRTQPTTTQTDSLLVVGNVYQHANLLRMGLFAPVALRVPFKFTPQNQSSYAVHV